MNRKLQIVVALFGIAAFMAVALKVLMVLQASEFKSPVAAVETVETPRDRALKELAEDRAAQEQAQPYVEQEYRQAPVFGSRVVVWVLAQLHLLFAAFVLAVPIFAMIIEAVGYFTGDKKYDKLAYEFIKLMATAFSLTATFGAGLTFALIALYPRFTTYLMHVFSPTFLPYVLLFFFEAAFFYSYYYGWGKFHPLLHLGLGFMLNV
ncbi:MAG: cytochrome ubiquinol oxidase subunit I, partial [Acidobacteria bacterium]|nr:cytochrome ubiquinol oxidase subunit I [Acidobacteriota bacterium]